MSRKRFTDMNCGIAQTLEQVGDWWTLMIVRDAFFGIRRFAQFEENLGISKNILSDRINKLLANDILRKERLKEPGVRYEYRLTPKGKDLAALLTSMHLWAMKWVFDKDTPLYAPMDKVSGRPVQQMIPADEQGQAIPMEQLRWRPRGTKL